MIDKINYIIKLGWHIENLITSMQNLTVEKRDKN